MPVVGQKTTLFALLVLAVVFVSLFFSGNFSRAALYISSPSSANLSTSIVVFANKTATTTIDYIEVGDDRVGSPGWSATMSMTHLTAASAPQTISGSHLISLAGRYDGTYGVVDPVKKYDIRITTAGAVGTAIFQWNVDGGAWTNNVVTATSVALEKGVQIAFSDSYDANDEWTFAVDVLPYTDLYVTPGSVNTINGSSTEVSQGATGYLAGTGATSTDKTVMSAPSGYGLGTYRQVESLDLNIHPNSLAGTYSGTLVFNVL